MRRTIKGAAALAAISAAAMAVAPMASADRFVAGVGVPGAVSGVNGGNVYGSDRIGTSLQALTAFDRDLSANNYDHNIGLALHTVKGAGDNDTYYKDGSQGSAVDLYHAYLEKQIDGNTVLRNIRVDNDKYSVTYYNGSVYDESGTPLKTDLYIVSTTGIVDALSLAPISKGNGIGGYVVYANKDGLDERGADAFKDLVAAQKLNRVFIVGGDAVLSNAVEQQLYSLEQQVVNDWTDKAMGYWAGSKSVEDLQNYNTTYKANGWNPVEIGAQTTPGMVYQALNKAAYNQFIALARKAYDVPFVRLAGADRYQTSYLAGAWAAGYKNMAANGYAKLWAIEEAGLRAWYANTEVQRTFADLQKAQNRVTDASYDLMTKQSALSQALSGVLVMSPAYKAAYDLLKERDVAKNGSDKAMATIAKTATDVFNIFDSINKAGYDFTPAALETSGTTKSISDILTALVNKTAVDGGILKAKPSPATANQAALESLASDATNLQKELADLDKSAKNDGYVQAGLNGFEKAQDIVENTNNGTLSDVLLPYFVNGNAKHVKAYTIFNDDADGAISAYAKKQTSDPANTSSNDLLLTDSILYNVVNIQQAVNPAVQAAALDLQKSRTAYTIALKNQATASSAYEAAQEEAKAAGADKINIDKVNLPTAADDYVQAQVAAYTNEVKGVYYSTGENFADALTAGPVAGKNAGNIVLLTPGKTFGTWDKAAALYAAQNASFYAVGGPAAEAAKAAKLDLAGSYVGKDRFETSVILNNAAFGANKAMYIVASGETGADAVVAGAYQVSLTSKDQFGGIILTKKSELPASADTFFKSIRWGSQVAVFFGGNQVITNDVRAQVLNDMGASKNVLANYIGDNTFAYGN